MKPRVLVFWTVLFALTLSGFRGAVELTGTKASKMPEYSEEKYWIALPWRNDAADTIPRGCKTPENQDSAHVDVFYVYPTVYVSGVSWNAKIDDRKINKRADMCVIHQATPFNSCARIFAPRYRQGHLKCFGHGGKRGEKALNLAYEDVKNAFEYYLTNWNKGRPIMLVGHSQGAYHVQRLLKDYFDNKPLLEQLVAAYPIGFNIQKNAFNQIPVGDSATQTGCFMTWNTVLWSQDTSRVFKWYRGSACVNPLTWKQTEEEVSGTKSKGAVPFKFNEIQYPLTATKVHGTLLWIKLTPTISSVMFYHTGTSYHISDMNLFYMDIRENAELRVKTYLQIQEK